MPSTGISDYTIPLLHDLLGIIGHNKHLNAHFILSLKYKSQQIHT